MSEMIAYITVNVVISLIMDDSEIGFEWKPINGVSPHDQKPSIKTHSFILILNTVEFPYLI